MGYYTGNGVTSGGGSAVQLHESTYWYGEHRVYQLVTTVVNKKEGVALGTAQAAVGAISMNNQTWSQGMVTFISHNCKGSKTNYTYNQIGDSNLYSLVATQETIKVQDGIGWAPTGWQS